MQKKTRKKLLIGIATLLAGLGGFYLAVNYWLPVIGIASAAAVLYGGLSTLDYTILGIAERVEFERNWAERGRTSEKGKIRGEDYVPTIKDKLQNFLEGPYSEGSSGKGKGDGGRDL